MVTGHQVDDTRSDRFDNSGTLMAAAHRGHAYLIADQKMDVAVADPARHVPDQNFVRPRLA